jgi:hypothetical protein
MRRSHFSVLALLLVACTSSPFTQPPPPEVAASMMLDSRGGTVAIRDRSSPLFGVTVHVPAGALTSPTLIEIRPSILPHDANALLAGPAVELLPRGATFAREVTVVLPVDDGISDPSFLMGGYLDEEARPMRWERLATSAAAFADPAAELDLEVTLTVDHFTHFAPLYSVSAAITVMSDLSTELDAEILAARPLSELTQGFTFVAPLEGVLGTSVRAGDATPARFEVLDGDFVVRLRSADGSDERCVVVTTPGPSPVARATSASPRCSERPTVDLAASATVARVGERVELTGIATSATGADLSYFWNRTGGILNDAEGIVSSGASTQTTWTPTRTGTYEVYFTAYDVNGLFSEDRAVILVRGNEPPEITSFLATPVQLQQGAPEGAREVAPMSVGDAQLGLTLLSASAIDPDGDPLLFYWWHGLPGNYFDPLTGAMLGRDTVSGLATDTATGLPFTADSVLYMAPPESWLCEGLPLGMWLGLHVTASDGSATDRSWVMVGMECVVGPPPGSDDGSHCYQAAPAWQNTYSGGAFCYGVAGPYADWITDECASTSDSAGAGPCPGGPNVGACVDVDTPDGSIGTRVLYDLSPAQAEEARLDGCTDPDEVFIYPYQP